jgi:hypothetical protein
MDYEFRIKQAELELSHLQALQALNRDRLDVNDSRLESLDTITRRTTENLDILTVQVGKLEAKIDQLVDALLHGKARNGGGTGGKA